MEDRSKSSEVIDFQNVSLDFPVTTKTNKSLKNEILNSLSAGFRKGRGDGIKLVKALKNIDCTIKEGERVGLIGHNGAGKSTFLRLACGIYMHSSGKVKRYKKIHPMILKTFLTGPESSGWEAAKASFLLENNTLHGFRKFMEDIEEFTQLDEFLKLPMKTYSEGMKARLMFAILTCGNHQCIGVDEGFGAGDTRFFKRASSRLEEFINRSGTVIMASHSEGLLQQFCTRGIVFKKGSIVYDGSLTEAFNFYNDRDY